MVRMDDQRSISALTRYVDEYITRNYPQVNASTKRVSLGPPATAPLKCALKARILTGCV